MTSPELKNAASALLVAPLQARIVAINVVIINSVSSLRPPSIIDFSTHPPKSAGFPEKMDDISPAVNTASWIPPSVWLP